MRAPPRLPPPRAPALLVGLLCLGALLPPTPARAEDRPLGEPWEVLILDGMQRQDARLKEASIDTVILEARNLERRPTTGDPKIARLFLLGRAYGKRLGAGGRDLVEARSAYEEALRLAPRCYFALRDLAMLALAGQPEDPRAAEGYLQRALTIYPGYVQALRDLARLCQKQKRHADAVVHLKRVIDLDRVDLLARAYLVSSLLELGRAEEARKEVDGLIRARPGQAEFRNLRAEVELASGREDAAIAEWRLLQKELPSSRLPLEGLLRAYLQKKRKNLPVADAELLGALNGLWFLERDPEKRARLDEMRRAVQAPATDPKAPPDDAALARALDAPDANVRGQALRYVAYREAHPTLELLRAVIGRLGPERERDPTVRSSALLVLARHGGLGTLPIARLSLYDAEPDVRYAALAALFLVGTQSVDAGRVATAVLGRHVSDPDARLAAAARHGLLTLTDTDLAAFAEGEPETEEALRARFDAWWAGPSGVETRIRALGAYAQAKDRLADQVLVPYLDDPDFFVMKAAYEALRSMRDYLPAGPRADWARGIPAFLPEELVPERRTESRTSLAAWLGLRPQ